MSKVEKELVKGVDWINSLVTDYDNSLKDNKSLGNVDIQRALEQRYLIIDYYAIRVLEDTALEDGGEKVLTDNELGVFVRNLLKETAKLKNKKL